MRKLLILTILLFLFKNSHSQLLLNNGAKITTGQNAYVKVGGAVENDKGKILNLGVMQIQGNFENNDVSITYGGGQYFITGDWINYGTFLPYTSDVFLNGVNQNIVGDTITQFYNLTLQNSGVKMLLVSSEVANTLNLNNLELATNLDTLFVLSTNLNSIIYDNTFGAEGFVSGNSTGRLYRNTLSNGNYTFPLGNTLPSYRYRPLEIVPVTNGGFYANFVNNDPISDGFTNIGPSVVNINNNFYHVIGVDIPSTADVSMNYLSIDGTFSSGANYNGAWSNISPTMPQIGTPFNKNTAINYSDFGNEPIVLSNIEVNCDSNAQNAEPVIYQCNIGIDLENNFYQELCFNSEDCYLHMYNLCIDDSATMQTIISSLVFDSIEYGITVLNGNFLDSTSCLLADLDSNDIYYASEGYDTLSINFEPGSYLIGIWIDAPEYLYSCFDLDIDFDQTITACSVQPEPCLTNTDCSSSIPITDGLVFTQDCDTCQSVSNQDYWFTLDVQDTLNLLISEISGVTSTFSYQIFMPQGGVVACDSSASFIEIDSASSVNQMSYTFNQIGQYLVLLTDLEDCPEMVFNTLEPNCPPNGGNVLNNITNVGCNLGIDVYDGFSQSICLCDESNIYWYNVCVEAGTTVTYNINSYDGTTIEHTNMIASGQYGGLPSCDMTDYQNSIIDNVHITTGSYSYTFTNDGSYLIGLNLISANLDLINFCGDISFNFDQPIVPCIVGDSCGYNAGCATSVEITGSYIFSENCTNCDINVSDEFWFTANDISSGCAIYFDQSTASQMFDYSIYEIVSSGNGCASVSANNLLDSGTGVSGGSYTFDALDSVIIVLSGFDSCPDLEINLACPPPDTCESCIASFAPTPGGKYLIGAWTKEKNPSATLVTYDQPEVFIHFTELDSLNNTTTSILGPFYPIGNIIDGWQRIEEEFIIPVNAIDMEIELSTAGTEVLFDDVRVFPFDSSMKTFVYDPINMRLAAELDERHYATFYEYDEEGKLVRIKKETEKGIMTIQETKSNSSKND